METKDGKKKRAKKKLTARIDADVLDRVAEIAEEENRSLSNMVEVFLSKAVEEK